MSINILRFIKFIFFLCILSFTAFSWIMLYSIAASLLLSVTTAYADLIGMIIASIIIVAIFGTIVYYYRKILSD